MRLETHLAAGLTSATTNKYLPEDAPPLHFQKQGIAWGIVHIGFFGVFGFWALETEQKPNTEQP